MKFVVIEAIGLHLGYLGCYGNDWVATPNLDRLASQGVVFDWHIADNPAPTAKPWSERSVGAGVYTFFSAADSFCGRSIEPRVVRCPALATFCADALRETDLSETWLWIEGPSLLPPWRLENELLDVYFDEDDVEEGLAPWMDPPIGQVNHTEADVLRVQNTYAAAVTVFDAQLGALLENLGEDVLICVTAHSGLPLGEHGTLGTSELCLHDEMVHVPLLLRLPGAASAGERISALTQPVDLLPTFLAALGEPLLPFHGHDLWPLLRGEVESIRPYAVAGMQVGDEQSWLLRTPELALHLPVRGEPTPRPLLFVKPDDRWEVNDLYQQQVESGEALESALRAFADRCRRAGPLEYPPLAH
jgi:hypothetical protein